MIKYVFIITIALCAIYKTKCPRECDVQVGHDHFLKACNDSLVALKDRKEVLEFLKTNKNEIKRIDSVKVN